MRFRFEDFELDTEAFELRRTGESVRVEPQVFAVLAYLVARRDRLVSRDELLDEVWGTRFVSDATVASRVKAARRAIGDDGVAQRLIRTVTGRGYRFVAPVEMTDGARIAPQQSAPSEPDLVGRADELASLAQHLQAVDSGAARLVFLTGEVGAGKSSLAGAFVSRLDVRHRWLGQCVAVSGSAEAYWPLLDALAAATREDEAVVDGLARYAPGWLVQLPVRLGDPTRDELASRALGATQGRLMREFLALVEALSEAEPVVLLLEDLHWADEPSLELLDAMVRLRLRARLLVIGTLRRTESSTGSRRAELLADELVARGLAHEIVVSPFSESDALAYVQRRIGAAGVPAWLPPLLVERTAGNPLFLRCLLDSWLAGGRIATDEAGILLADRAELARDIPATAGRLIAAQLADLEPASRMLVDAASVAGVRFAAAEVAAAIGREPGEVDDELAGLAREAKVVRGDGEASWLDGTRCGVYRFVHELVRDAVYEQLSPSRRASLHGLVGQRLEQGHAGTGEQYVAVQLAHHFLEARDGPRAVRYLQAAAEVSLARSAHAEAARQATLALELLATTPDAGGALEVEIALRSILAAAQIALRGWAAPEIQASYEPARELCEATGDTQRLAAAVYGLATLHEYRGEYERSEALMSRQLDVGATALEPEALELLACSTFHQGQYARSLAFAERALASFDASLTSEYLARFGESPVVSYHCWAALSLWFLGGEAEALAHRQAALDAAEAHVYSQTTALAQAAFLAQFRGDPAEARCFAEATVDVATEHGFPFRVAQATIVRGWALAAAGESERGATELVQGLERYRATGASMDLPYYFGLASEVAAWRGRVEEALALLRDARALLPERGFFYEPQLLRLEAVLRGEHDPVGAAALLERAAAAARKQGAPTLAAELSILLESYRTGEPAPLTGSGEARHAPA
jgi:DNA-binding winged helix-turn-helix (wHTH) protein/tetratricopeptide (TPR) repeat protein